MNPRKEIKARQAAMQAALAGIEGARNAGADYFKTSPNEMLVEVCRRASMLFDNNEHAIAYLRGYSEARIQHDSFKRGD